MKLIDTDLFVGADTFSFETTMFQSELWKSMMIKGPWSPPVVPGCAVCSNYTINPVTAVAAAYDVFSKLGTVHYYSGILTLSLKKEIILIENIIHFEPLD